MGLSFPVSNFRNMNKDQYLTLTSDRINSLGLAVGELAKNRCDELVADIRNDERIVPAILETPSFQAITIDIIQKFIIETSEEKRKLFKKILLNTAKGLHSDFDEKTRLVRTLENISLDEIRVLNLWRENGPMQTNPVASQLGSVTLTDIKCIVREMRLKASSEIEDGLLRDLEGPSRPTSDKYNQILISLGNKGLLYTLSADNFGSGEEARVKNITDFGSVFLKFISE
jgi:hypothetical protein